MRARDAVPRRPVRFLFVLPSLQLGGAERQALLLARDLAERERAHVQVWGFGEPGPVVSAAERLGIEGRSVPLPPGGARVDQVRFTAWFVRQVRRAAADVLLPYSRVPNRLCGLTWRWAGARLCVWNHRDGGNMSAPTRADRWAMRRTPVVVSNSRHGAEFLARAYAIPLSRIAVVHNGVELAPARDDRAAWRARLGAGARTFVASMLANLTSNKDHATLLRAWRTVVDVMGRSRLEALLVLAGFPGETAPALERLAADLRLAASVRFTGQIDDVTGLLEASDLGVFSSRHEGSPNGVLECMAAGLAVVGTDIDGIREAVGEAGYPYLAPSGDHESFAGHILALANDPALRTEIGRENRGRVTSIFSPTRMGARMAGLFAAHLEQR